ncbi:MAG: 2-C-methyl-D-erythritol 4-phosphate cytidylyltransferase [Candidatus Poribacteria bacterium]|nr:2-C-methyl-D-erythritol 4-phosphate cytidylyltransferase [Candidatus Poribacteria bacterium]
MAHLRIKKPYLQLLDKPVLSRTIDAFDRSPIVDAIYVIVGEGDFEVCRSVAIAPYGFQKVADLVSGGETRQDSVFNGLQALPDDTDFVMVHDGVRPFVTDEMIFACLEAADDWGAAVAAVPVKDTIKVANDDGFVVETPKRSQLWAIQTPQVFRKALLVEAHQRARQKQIRVTDDAALVEQLGFKVKLVMGSYRNLKITTPEDLIVAEALLKHHA